MPTKKIHEYPWYKIASPEDDIQQGDFFYKLPVIQATSKISDIDFSKIEPGTPIEQSSRAVPINCIVMTHSCDFQAETPDDYQVLVCPIYEVCKTQQEQGAESIFINTDKWTTLVKGRSTDHYLLMEFNTEESGMSFPYHVVDLTTVYSIEYGLLKVRKIQQGRRIKLQPPYREHLAQAFAKRFMRIGLPEDLPPTRPW